MTKPKRQPRLDWARVWDLQDTWYQDYIARERRKRCKSCGASPSSIDPDWDEQQESIQRIVERELRKS